MMATMAIEERGAYVGFVRMDRGRSKDRLSKGTAGIRAQEKL